MFMILVEVDGGNEYMKTIHQFVGYFIIMIVNFLFTQFKRCFTKILNFRSEPYSEVKYGSSS